MAASDARLDANDGQRAGERGRLHIQHGEILRAGIRRVCECADHLGAAGIRDVDHSHAPASLEMVAAARTDVSVVPVSVDVAKVDVGAEVGMTDQPEVVQYDALRRCGRRPKMTDQPVELLLWGRRPTRARTGWGYRAKQQKNGHKHNEEGRRSLHTSTSRARS